MIFYIFHFIHYDYHLFAFKDFHIAFQSQFDLNESYANLLTEIWFIIDPS
jgi:hypothetical protein